MAEDTIKTRRDRKEPKFCVIEAGNLHLNALECNDLCGGVASGIAIECNGLCYVGGPGRSTHRTERKFPKLEFF